MAEVAAIKVEWVKSVAAVGTFAIADYRRSGTRNAIATRCFRLGTLPLELVGWLTTSPYRNNRWAGNGFAALLAKAYGI